MPYADNLVLMSETVERLKDNVSEWKETFQSKCSKVYLGKTKLVVSGGIIEDGLS